MSRIKVLYLQHAGSLGGSAMSLWHLLCHLNRDRYEAVVGLVRANDQLRRLYRQIDVSTVDVPDITTYEHTTGRSWGYRLPPHWWRRVEQYLEIQGGARATIRAVEALHPDLVHLNSVVLLPSAIGLKHSGIPFVWHVREHPEYGLFGHRRRFIRDALLRFGDEVLFLSEADRIAWLGKYSRGIIFPNTVDFSLFDTTLEKSEARRSIGLSNEDQVILFLGGISPVKGTLTFLEAVRKLHQTNPKIRVIMPIDDGIAENPLWVKLARRLLGPTPWGTYHQRSTRLMMSSDLTKILIILPMTTNVPILFAACDVLTFPHTAPHFARPVIEAAAMMRPVVASDLPGIREIVHSGETGLLVPPRNASALCDALRRILSHPAEAQEMGKRAYDHAIRDYNIQDATRRLHQIYKHILVQSRQISG